MPKRPKESARSPTMPVSRAENRDGAGEDGESGDVPEHTLASVLCSDVDWTWEARFDCAVGVAASPSQKNEPPALKMYCKV